MGHETKFVIFIWEMIDTRLDRGHPGIKSTRDFTEFLDLSDPGTA